MALILVRADSDKKILNALADLERHAKLKIIGKPRILQAKIADKFMKSVLKQDLKSKTKFVVMVRVQEDTTKSIMQVKKIHPPAHIMVLSREYDDYSELEKIFKDLKPLRGYYSHKNTS
jgi:hypothetical protein